MKALSQQINWSDGAVVYLGDDDKWTTRLYLRSGAV